MPTFKEAKRQYKQARACRSIHRDRIGLGSRCETRVGYALIAGALIGALVSILATL